MILEQNNFNDNFDQIKKYQNEYTGPKWPWSTQQASPMSEMNGTSCKVLHGNFEPVYLLQVSKNDDEKHCFLK